MNQRLTVLLATVTVVLAVPLAATLAQEAAKTETATTEEAKIPAGQKLFLDNGCTTCHSMKGQGLEKKKTTASATTASTTSKAPDLSAAGLEHDQAWITKFLQKTEMLHGKKHMKTWKGTDEQLTTLTTWLAEQKNAEAAGVKISADKAAQTANEAKQQATEAKQEAKEATQDAKAAEQKADEAKEKAEEAKDQAKEAKDQTQGK